MKKLDIYIRESILDDEDTLIGNATKDSKNPFIIILNSYLEKGNKLDLKDILLLDKKLFTGKFAKYSYENYIEHKKKHTSKPEYSWDYNDTFIKISLKNYECLLDLFFQKNKLCIFIRNGNEDKLWEDFKKHIIREYDLKSITYHGLRDYFTI